MTVYMSSGSSASCIETVRLRQGSRYLLGLIAVFLFVGPVYAMVAQEHSTCSEDVVQYIRTDESSSLATVVGDVPLAHTRQFLALDDDDGIVGEDSPSRQTAQVLDNIRDVLREAGSDLDAVLKLNVYVTRDDVVEEVREEFANTFSGRAKPAVSFVVSNLPHPEALVGIDAVAAVCGASEEDSRGIQRVEALGGSSAQGHVAMLPPGGKMYVSGQVAPGDLLTATEGTMESLLATLAYFGLSADDVVQVKAFMPDISEASEVEERVNRYFREQPAPPFVPVEWSDSSYLPYLSTEGDDATPIEIELIAGREGEQHADRVPESVASYLTPPSLSAPLTYSRAVEYHRGDLVYVSGLYGDPEKDAEGQVREIYSTLEDVLQEAGSGLDYLLKGTYYVTGSEANDWIDEVREELYDPSRAPASAKMPVEAVGKERALVTLDMVGVAP